MNHYHIDIVINERDKEIIEEQFSAYLEAAGEFSFVIRDNSDTEPSPELQEVLKRMFIILLMSIDHGKYYRVN